jgi:CRISPR-associated protein (TIGR02710 family)
MTRVLIVSVGGSPDPILKAVELHQPDEVIFACSAPPCSAPSLEQVIGDGTPCLHRIEDGEELRPNLVIQLGLEDFRPDLQLIELPDPDDLNDCLIRLRAFVQTLPSRFSQLDLCGDFTGGTKSMSTALAFALLDQQATLSVVSGRRDNLVRIEKSEGLRIIDPIPVLAHRLIKERLPPLLEAHFYDRARSLLLDFQVDLAERLSPTQQEALGGLIDQLQVLVLWDRFRWREALEAAQAIRFDQLWPDLHAWWLRVEAAIDWDPADNPAVAITGYELVQDLLLNAGRRGRRGSYDDAVARLYRATELLSQTYILLELGLAAPPDWSQRKMQLASGERFDNTGVSGLYRWLQRHESDCGNGKAERGLGSFYAKQGSELRKLFDARNRSLLGHGLSPIDEDTWTSLQNRVTNLLNTMLVVLGNKQGDPPCQLPGPRLLQQPLVAVLFHQPTTHQP